MGIYTNVYDTPEQYDLRIVGVIEDDAQWEFEMLVVWQHKSGKLYYATDEGCSCPSPFENFESVDSLTQLNKRTYAAFCREVDRGDYGAATSRTRLKAKVHDLLYNKGAN